MLFFFGIVIGMLLSLVVFLAFLYVSMKRGSSFVSKAVQKTEEVARGKVKIYMPPSEEEEARDSIVEKNEKKGIGTPLTDLGL